MLSTFFQPSEVKIHLLQNVIFLHPPEAPTTRPPATDAPPQTDDELVRGLIELHVPSDRHIGGIRVRLRASEMIGILDQQTNTVPVNWDERIIMDKTLEIGVPARHSARSRSRAPATRPVSRAPSRPRSPEEPCSRRNSSTDSDSEDRGRAASRDTSRSRRDPSMSGLAGALAAAMRGRSHTRSASKPSRPSSPGGRGRSSSRHPVQGGLFTATTSASIATVPGRRSVSTHAPLRGEEPEDRGRSHHRPPIVPEESAPSQHYHPVRHHPSLHESSRSPSMSLLHGSSRPSPHEDAFEAEDDEGMFVAKGIHGYVFGLLPHWVLTPKQI